jgi:hypothetical protein
MDEIYLDYFSNSLERKNETHFENNEFINFTDVTFSFDVIRIVRNGSAVGKAVGRLLPLYIVGSPSSG